MPPDCNDDDEYTKAKVAQVETITTLVQLFAIFSSVAWIMFLIWLGIKLF